MVAVILGVLIIFWRRYKHKDKGNGVHRVKNKTKKPLPQVEEKIVDLSSNS